MNKPIYILAPMDDVTDTIFRRIVHDCSPPDLTMTEFVNVDGLCSVGRPRLMPKLKTDLDKTDVIAQIWGKNPDNFYAVAKELSDGAIPGFVGIDLNFGCPAKSEVRAGCCSALQKPELRDEALAIIKATQEGAAAGKNNLPVSFKTRLGYSVIDYTWHEFLLEQKPSMLSVHVRTTKQMSKVPAQWECIEEIVKLRDKISPDTKIIMNGDIMNRAHGDELTKRYGIDGVMIGRGVFHDPFCFSSQTRHQQACQYAEQTAPSASSDPANFSPPVLASSYKDTPGSVLQRENPHDLDVPSLCKCPGIWESKSRTEREAILIKHLTLHKETYPNDERKFNPVKKFAKLYISGFDGAAEFRNELMNTESIDEMLELLKTK